MLVFCNLANWSQYFLSKSDSSCTWAKWFANRTKNFDPQPGTGQCLHFSFFILTVRKQTLNWTNLLATRNLSFIFEGTTGTKGIKGRNWVVVFFSGTREKVAWGSCAWERTRAWSQRITRNAFYIYIYIYINCFIYESHTLQFFDTHLFLIQQSIYNTVLYI